MCSAVHGFFCSYCYRPPIRGSIKAAGINGQSFAIQFVQSIDFVTWHARAHWRQFDISCAATETRSVHFKCGKETAALEIWPLCTPDQFSLSFGPTAYGRQRYSRRWIALPQRTRRKEQLFSVRVCIDPVHMTTIIVCSGNAEIFRDGIR